MDNQRPSTSKGLSPEKQPRLSENNIDYENILKLPNSFTQSSRALMSTLEEQLMCSICKKVPEAKVFQCGGIQAHTICQRCRETEEWKPLCTLCKATLKSSEGQWIRNSTLEQILDKIKFLCPFRSKGCNKTFNRGNARQHVENECDYSGLSLKICRLLYSEDNNRNCEYRTNCVKPRETLHHFWKHHGGLKPWDPKDGDLKEAWYIPVYLKNLPDKTRFPLVVCDKEMKNYVLVAHSVDNQKKSWNLWAVSPSSSENTGGRVDVVIDNKSGRSQDMILRIPVCAFAQAANVLDSEPIIAISMASIEEHYLDEDNRMTLCVKVE